MMLRIVGQTRFLGNAASSMGRADINWYAMSNMVSKSAIQH